MMPTPPQGHPDAEGHPAPAVRLPASGPLHDAGLRKCHRTPARRQPRCGRTLYTWVLAGENGAEATCSNGASFRVDIGLDEIERDDILLVCGGIDVQRATTKAVLNWLRREARRGVTMGGLCTGAYALARQAFLTARRPPSTGKTRTASLRNSRM